MTTFDASCRKLRREHLLNLIADQRKRFQNVILTFDQVDALLELPHAPPKRGYGRRFARIKAIIEAVDHRCCAADGPVTPTLQEMEQREISAIYALACGQPESWRPK